MASVDDNCPVKDTARERYAMLGAIVSFLGRRGRAAGLQIAAISAWVEPAIILGQAKVFFDEYGAVNGYLAWAYLSEAVERRWMAAGPYPLAFSDWNDVGNLWIISGGFRERLSRGSLLKLCSTPPFSDAPSISLLHHDRDRVSGTSHVFRCHLMNGKVRRGGTVDSGWR